MIATSTENIAASGPDCGAAPLFPSGSRLRKKDGRVSEERLIWEHPEKMFPAQVHADMLKAGVSIEELRQKLMELMGGDPMASSIVYTYDAQGRVKETRQRIFNTEYTIDATYNEQGDKVIEITRCAAIGGQNRQAQRPGLPSYYEVGYSYEYDDHGNWTEETLSQRSSPDEGFKSSPGRRRQLTYY